MPRRDEPARRRTSRDDEARRLVAGNVRPVAPTGTSVRLVVHATSAGLKSDLERMARVSLKNSGLKDGPGDLTLTINAKEVVSGKFIPYSDPISRVSENAAHRTIECAAVLTDKSGRERYRDGRVASPPANLTFMQGKASQAVAAEVHGIACSWAGRLNFPPTAHVVKGELVHLPLVVPYSEKAALGKGR